MTWIPWAMVWLRVVLCPMIVLGARWGWAGRWLGGIVLVALVDDVYDGVLARRWGCDTPAIRMADSVADTIFYLGVAWTLWIKEPQVLRDNRVLLAMLGGLEVTRYGFDFWKFGKAASYHSDLAKAWGLIMAVGLICVLSFGGPAALVWISLVLGIVVNCEGLAMSLMLPRWKNDVKTLGAALRLRRHMLRQE